MRFGFEERDFSYYAYPQLKEGGARRVGQGEHVGRRVRRTEVHVARGAESRAGKTSRVEVSLGHPSILAE